MDRAVVGMQSRISEPAEYADAVAPLALELDPDARLLGAPAGAPRTSEAEREARAAHGVLRELGGQLEDALTGGRFPVLIHGDCTMAAGTLPVLARLRPDAKVLWLDAHADFNTPQSSDSGLLTGMGLAGACGLWDTGIEGAFDPERVVLCGVRELDAGERELVERSGLTVIGASLETLVYLRNALDGDPVFIHLDPDVLDPDVFDAEFPAPGGLPEDKLYDLIDAVADASEVIGVEIGSFRGDDTELIARVLSPVIDDDEDLA